MVHSWKIDVWLFTFSGTHLATGTFHANTRPRDGRAWERGVECGGQIKLPFSSADTFPLGCLVHASRVHVLGLILLLLFHRSTSSPHLLISKGTRETVPARDRPHSHSRFALVPLCVCVCVCASLFLGRLAGTTKRRPKVRFFPALFPPLLFARRIPGCGYSLCKTSTGEL